WMAGEMRAPDGGFYAAVDADSEGVEGRFYTWTPDEVAAILEPRAATLATAYFGVTADGPVDGRSVLSTPEPPADVPGRQGTHADEARALPAAAQAALPADRARRVPPAPARKIILAWDPPRPAA